MLFVSLYNSALKNDTKTILFRLTHGVEIFVVILLFYLVYFHYNSNSLTFVLGFVFITLLVLDLLIFTYFNSLIQKFDFIHFTVAYISVALAVVLAYVTTKK